MIFSEDENAGPVIVGIAAFVIALVILVRLFSAQPPDPCSPEPGVTSCKPKE